MRSRNFALALPTWAFDRVAAAPERRVDQGGHEAHKWKHRLFSGEAPTIQAIADEEGLNERYAGRILRLAFLAPDIVEAVIDGRRLADLDLDRLLNGIMERCGSPQIG